MKHLTEEQIQSYINEPKKYANLMDHINQCDQCRELYRSYVTIHQDLSSLEYEQPSLRFAKNIYELLVRKQALEQKEKKWIRILQVSIFGSFFLMSFMVFYYLFSSTWDIPFSDSSMSVYYRWSIITLLSTVILWILYGFDQWYIKRKSK